MKLRIGDGTKNGGFEEVTERQWGQIRGRWVANSQRFVLSVYNANLELEGQALKEIHAAIGEALGIKNGESRIIIVP